MNNNNNNPQHVLPDTPAPITGRNNITTKPVTEEIVICDECGDTMWDKVLAQTNTIDNISKIIVTGN